MRFEKGRREKIRKHILEMAARRLRKSGLAASGLAGILAEAGPTNGAFRLHFESKEALLREAPVHVWDDQRIGFGRDNRAGGDRERAVVPPARSRRKPVAGPKPLKSPHDR